MSTATGTPPRQQPTRGLRVVRAVLVWSGFVLGPPIVNALLVVSAGSGQFGLAYALPVAAVLLLLLALRRAPVVAVALMFVNIVVVAVLATPEWGTGFLSDVRAIQLLAVNIAVGYLAATRRPWVSIVAAVVVLVAEFAVSAGFKIPLHGPAGPGVTGSDVTDNAVRYTLVVIVAWMIGNMVGQRRRDAAARRAEAEAAAIHEERLRIARELHDMIAHSIGVIAIQAGMGRRVIDTQPDEARGALSAIEDTSRETLSALRRMVGTLRRAGTAPSPLEPAPGLTDLDALVARSLDAGVKVEVRWRGERRPLPRDVELSAFRIVQEAVTNVVRHAGTHRCEVLVDWRTDELFIEVVDDGRGGFAGIGYGIAGMRERVSLFGGELSAGPRREGGFRIAARLPTAESAR